MFKIDSKTQYEGSQSLVETVNPHISLQRYLDDPNRVDVVGGGDGLRHDDRLGHGGHEPVAWTLFLPHCRLCGCAQQ